MWEFLSLFAVVALSRTMWQEYNKFRDTLAKGGLKSYLNYYKVAVRSLNYEDDQSKSYSPFIGILWPTALSSQK